MKKGIKQAGVLTLVTSMLAASLAGCGGSASNNAKNDAATNEVQNANKGDSLENGEIVKLRVWGFAYTATSEECAAIAEAVSEITRDKIGVEVELVRNSDGEKLNLALTSGEQLDLVNYHTYAGGLSALVTNGMAMPIDDLAKEYAQEAIDLVGEDMLVAGKVNGTLYSIPNINDYANGYGIAMRKDVLDDLGIDVETIKTEEDIHDVLVRVKEERSDLYPLVPTWGGGGMQKGFAFDSLGTGFWDACGVLENVFDDSTTVVNLYETDSYREFCERMYAWNKEGLVMPDATTFNEANPCATVGFADFDNNKPTKESELRLRWGVLDPNEALPKFNEELKAAGIDTIIAEKQKQLDAFLAENK